MKIPELSNLDFGLVWAAHNLIRGRMLCRIGLAQSGHRLLHCTCPLLGVKRTWRVQCECLLMMLWTAPALRHRSAIDWFRQSESRHRHSKCDRLMGLLAGALEPLTSGRRTPIA